MQNGDAAVGPAAGLPPLSLRPRFPNSQRSPESLLPRPTVCALGLAPFYTPCYFSTSSYLSTPPLYFATLSPSSIHAPPPYRTQAGEASAASPALPNPIRLAVQHAVVSSANSGTTTMAHVLQRQDDGVCNGEERFFGVPAYSQRTFGVGHSPC